MLKTIFTQVETDELYYQFMGHPAGTVRKKLHVVYLKSLNLPHQDIALIARVSDDTVTRYLKEFNEEASMLFLSYEPIHRRVNCFPTKQPSKPIFKVILRILFQKPLLK